MIGRWSAGLFQHFDPLVFSFSPFSLCISSKITFNRDANQMSSFSLLYYSVQFFYKWREKKENANLSNKKLLINENIYLWTIYFMSFSFSFCTEQRVTSLCRVYNLKQKRTIFVRRFFFSPFSCVSLEWHRFEFFMQIEGWWDKNKLYNCRWNGRATGERERKGRKKMSESIFYIRCDREHSLDERG